MIRNYRDLTRKEMEAVDRKNTPVLIPLGALEQHGSQAPLGTDDIIAEAMRDEIIRHLREKDPEYEMLVFPVIPVGLSTEHKNFCGSITFHPDTYYHILHDIAESLVHHGFAKLIFLVCHGGNAPVVQILSRELRSEYGIAVFQLSSGAFFHPEVRATLSKSNDNDFHGGEMETSMVMAVHPELVHLEDSEAGHRKQSFHANGASLNWVSEDFITDEGKPIGIGGDPSGATAEKGKTILRVSARELLDAFEQIRDYTED